MDGVVRGPDYGALGDMVAVDKEAAGEDFAREDAADGGGDSQCLVEDGAEVGAGGDAGAYADVFDAGEGGADFVVEGGEGFGVVEEVEESGCDGIGHCVGAW